MIARLLAIACLTLLLLPGLSQAQDSSVGEVLEPNPELSEGLPPDQFAWAEVLAVVQEGTEVVEGTSLPYQHLVVRITSGPERGQELELEHGTRFTIRPSQLLDDGDRFLLGKSTKVDGSSYYFVADRSRLPALAWLLVLFAGVVAAVAGRRGAGAFLGLALSLAILMLYVVPRILDGANPLLVSILGATLIALLSIYLAHGIRGPTTIALAGTIVTLTLAGLLAVGVVGWLSLSGAGTEEAFLLQLGQTGQLDLRGLLLGGIIIGALGVLDDITTAQAALVAELKQANPALAGRELYRRSLNVGREHILSLVNTLVLAYAGASLPIFLFFQLNTTTPWWVILNGEFLAEEIVRTLVGSLALILAVPITTLLAVWAYGRWPGLVGGGHGQA